MKSDWMEWELSANEIDLIMAAAITAFNWFRLSFWFISFLSVNFINWLKTFNQRIKFTEMKWNQTAEIIKVNWFLNCGCWLVVGWSEFNQLNWRQFNLISFISSNNNQLNQQFSESIHTRHCRIRIRSLILIQLLLN